MERGWIPVSEITDDMLVAHRTAHPPGLWYVAVPGNNFYTARPREGREGNPLTGDRARITVAAPVSADHVWVDIRLPAPGIVVVTDRDRLELMWMEAAESDRDQSLYGWAADTIAALRDQVDAQDEQLVAARARWVAADYEAAARLEQALREVDAKDDRLVAAAEAIQRLQDEVAGLTDLVEAKEATSRRRSDRILSLSEERNDILRRLDAAQGTIKLLLSQVDALRAQLALLSASPPPWLPGGAPPPMRWGPLEVTCRLIEPGK